MRALIEVDVSPCAELLADPKNDPVAHVWMTHEAESPVVSFSMDRGQDLMSAEAARCVMDRLQAMKVSVATSGAFVAGRTFRLRPHNANAAVASPFNRSAAAAVLSGVEIQSCHTDGAPTGSGHVKVVFAPDGTVTSAEVDQRPFVGTPVSECVEYSFIEIRVPPFAGTSVPVGKSFTIE